MQLDIVKAIQLIDAKIEKLAQAKQTLIELFATGDVETKTTSAMPTASLKPTHFTHDTQAPRVSRKQSIVNLLTERGPLSKKDIQAITGMPRGSVSFSLNDKTKFYSRDGKWHLVDDQNSLETTKPGTYPLLAPQR